MGDKVRFAIVGTGQMANTMAVVLADCEYAEVVSVCSGSIDRARKFAEKFDIGSHTGCLDDILQYNNIEAVYIANSNEKHVESSVRCLDAGKAVLCEKPCALDAQEFSKIEEAARRSSSLFVEGLWTLTLPSYQRLKQLILDRKLGQALNLTASFGYPETPETSPHLFHPNHGGVLYDRAVYLFAVSIYLFGSVKHLHHLSSLNESGVDVDFSALLEHDSGQTSVISASLSAMHTNNIFVGFEKGFAEVVNPALGSEELIIQESSTKDEIKGDPIECDLGLSTRLLKSSLLRRVKNQLLSPKKNYCGYSVSPYMPQLNHFCDLVANERIESSIVSIELSRQIAEHLGKLKANSSG